jgi:ankyrin repeat protein
MVCNSFYNFFQHDKEKPDARGRTPLMLAVTLGHLESARTLLQHATNVNTENREGWTGNIFYMRLDYFIAVMM